MECRGQIAISFAQLEHVLWVSPKRVTKLRFSDWEQIAGRVSIGGRCEQIAHAYAVRKMNQAQEAELSKLLKEVTKAAEARNSIVHARWGCKKRAGKVIARYRVWKGKNLGAAAHGGGGASIIARQPSDPSPADRWRGKQPWWIRTSSGSMRRCLRSQAIRMRFSAQSGTRPMIETIPLEQAAPAYDRMMVGKARFRVVLVTGR
jgi:hypothetical protein